MSLELIQRLKDYARQMAPHHRERLGNVLLVEALNMLETSAKAHAKETERADFAWKNTMTIDKARIKTEQKLEQVTGLLTKLVYQVGVCAPVDELGHEFKMNVTYLKAVEFLNEEMKDGETKIS